MAFGTSAQILFRRIKGEGNSDDRRVNGAEYECLDGIMEDGGRMEVEPHHG